MFLKRKIILYYETKHYRIGSVQPEEFNNDIIQALHYFLKLEQANKLIYYSGFVDAEPQKFNKQHVKYLLNIKMMINGRA